MDVSSFLKKLKQQQQNNTGEAAVSTSLSGLETSAGSGDTRDVADALYSTSASSSDDDDGAHEEASVGNEFRVRTGGERLKRKQMALFSKKAPHQGRSFDDSPLKLLASNSGTGTADSGSVARRDGARRLDALRQHVHSQASRKRPRTDTLDAIRNQLLDERRKLERAREWDVASMSTTAGASSSLLHDSADTTGSATQAVADMLEIGRLLDDAAQPVRVTLPATHTHGERGIVTGSSPLPASSADPTPVVPPTVSSASSILTQQLAAATTGGAETTENKASVSHQTAEKPKKLSMFARAKQLVQQGTEESQVPKDTLHYDRF